MWYPPIYPTPPYGIDPLHFFIDLRVSGHIYDRQNNHGKDGVTNLNQTSTSTVVAQDENSLEKKDIKVEEPIINNIFNQKRHCSAFSVPNASGVSKNRATDKSQTKFDVKSMGFDKSSNKTGTNYIMSNISRIYKNLLAETKPEAEVDEPMTIDVDTDDHDVSATNPTADESEAEKQKKVKDLRALIGLELVVDYMSHKKGTARSDQSSVASEEGEISSEEVESCGSPQLEVVAVHDEV